ncbi:hypothetical protein ACMDM8_20320 [Comamonas resistens]
MQFTGKVGQAAAGDVVNKAPQYSNTVNLSLAAGGNTPRSGEYLTIQQQNILRDLVRQVATSSGCENLVIWREVLARASAKNSREIPLEEYRDLEEFLRRKLDAGGKPSAPPQPVPQPVPLLAPAALGGQEALPEPVPSAPPSSPKLPIVMAACSLAIALASVYTAWHTQSQLEALGPHPEPSYCQYDGKLYSPGSVMAHGDGPARCEVTAHWTTVDSRPKRVGARGQ